MLSTLPVLGHEVRVSHGAGSLELCLLLRDSDVDDGPGESICWAFFPRAFPNVDALRSFRKFKCLGGIWGVTKRGVARCSAKLHPPRLDLGRVFCNSVRDFRHSMICSFIETALSAP